MGGKFSIDLFYIFPYRKLDHEGVHDGSDHGDEVEDVPVVFEIALNRNNVIEIALNRNNVTEIALNKF